MNAPAGPLDLLSAETRALLAMARNEGRSYVEIAGELGLDPDEVRERAHAAGDELVGDSADPPPIEARARIVDLLLGQQPASDRARTRAMLDGSELGRDWAHALEAALDADDEPWPDDEEADADGPDRDGKPIVLPRLGHTRRPLAFAVAALFLAATAIAVVLGTGSGGTSTHAGAPATTSSSSNGGARHKPAHRGALAKTLQHLVFAPAGTEPHATGAGAVVQQGNTTLLLIEGRGLSPNRNNSYAVWLYNTDVDSRLLGFISPAVGSTGTFSSGAPLPDDAVRFGQLLITLETASRPARPGPVVLRSNLSLG